MRSARLLLFLFLAGLFACEDIIVPDIGTKTPVILAPADSAVVATASVTFRWEAVSGAEGYQLQIAQPSFAAANRYLLDTVTTKAIFSKALVPGNYQWRIRAVNSGYSGAYITRFLRVDSAGSIANEDLILTQPGNGSATNAATIELGWQPLAAADRYLVHLSPSPRGSTANFDTLVYGSSQLSLRVPLQNQQYQWSVTALNATGVTQSATYTFNIDISAPAGPSLLSPLDSAGIALDSTVAFSWTRAATDVVRDSLFLYLADQTTLLTSFPRSFTASSFSWPATDPALRAGTYFWAVRSVDRAGNVGPLSIKRRLRLQ